MSPRRPRKNSDKSTNYDLTASSFLTLGGHSILDYCNTKVIHSESIEDRLGNSSNQIQSFFSEILHESTIINDSDVKTLIQFREFVRTLLESLASGLSSEKELKTLNKLLLEHHFHPSVNLDRSTGFRIEWKPTKKSRSPMELLILKLIEFLSFSKSDRIKKCANPNCSHLFYDSSKNNSRSWCSMNSCGNIMKARAFYARSKLLVIPLLFLLIAPLSPRMVEAKVINITGNERSSQTIIKTEVELSNPQTPENIQQNLLRTGLFLDVQVTEDPENIHIQIKEKWTTIPILKFNSGGGADQSIFGLYDPNISGKRVELGYQHERLESAPSHVGWLKIPRLFESRYFLDLQYWNTKRIRLKYNPDLDDPSLIRALLLQTERSYISLGYEINSNLHIKGLYEKRTDAFSTDIVPTEFLDQVSGQTVPDGTTADLYGVQIDWNQYRYDNTATLGDGLSVLLKRGQTRSSSNDSFYTLLATWQHFQELTTDFIFAQRLQVGHTTSKTLQYWHYLGGLESIRGFKDNRFAAGNYWLSNSELRHLISTEKFAQTQVTAFIDALGTDESSNALKNIQALSAGLGLRLIMPQFYRLTLRFDYARPLKRNDNENLSFGIQQFF